MQIKEIYKDGMLIEKQIFKKNKSVLQLIVLGLMLLSVLIMVTTKTIMQHYIVELPCWFWVIESISPIICVALFAIYEIIRE